MPKQEIGPREKALQELREKKQGKYAAKPTPVTATAVNRLLDKVTNLKMKPPKKARRR